MPWRPGQPARAPQSRESFFKRLVTSSIGGPRGERQGRDVPENYWYKGSCRFLTPLGPGVIKTRFPLEYCALDLIYLLPLLPATGAVINGLIGMRSFGRRSVATIACATISF